MRSRIIIWPSVSPTTGRASGLNHESTITQLFWSTYMLPPPRPLIHKENWHRRRPLSCLTPHISRTPVNICITLISLETTFTGLHFCCRQYRSICIQIFVVGSERQAWIVIECIMAVQGHPRSLIFTPIESSLSASSNLVVSCTVLEILLHKGRKITFLPYLPCFEAPSRGYPVRISRWNLSCRN